MDAMLAPITPPPTPFPHPMGMFILNIVLIFKMEQGRGVSKSRGTSVIFLAELV
jgi:hypothetical protein